MFFTNRSQVTKYIIITAIKTFAVVVFAAVVCYILSERITKISNALYTQKRLAILLQEKESRQSQLKTEYARVAPHLKAMQNALPQDDNIGDFLANLDSIAKEQNLQKTLKFNDPIQAPDSNPSFPTAVLSYQLATTGNIFTSIKFIKSLETVPFANTVESINMSAPANPKGWEDTSSLTLTGQLLTRGDLSTQTNE